MRKRSSPRRANRGFALLALFAFLMAGVLYFVVTSLGPNFFEAYRARKTEAALAEARDALIGYALQYRDDQLKRYYAGDIVSPNIYGFLPMPDLGETQNRNGDLASSPCYIEGCAKLNTNATPTGTYIGRFPWRTLGTGPIRDGYGECLWYVVSASHKNINNAGTMNWDVLAQLDIVIADGDESLRSIVATAHDRPVAIIFSPGPITGAQERERQNEETDDVTECGGNYNPANYIEPSIVAALRNFDNSAAPPAETAYYDGSVATNTIAKRLAISTSGRIFLRESDDRLLLFANACPAQTNCALVANDVGLAVAPDTLFGALRKHANFRIDINSMLDRIVGYLRDNAPTPGDTKKIDGADDNAFYGQGVVPLGYYPSYKDMIFVASGTVTVNGESCVGAVLFANQRGDKAPPPLDPLLPKAQSRATNDDKIDFTNYLEGTNLSAAGPFSGPGLLDRVSSMQTVSQDIVRCIPATPSFVTTTSPGLDAVHLPQLANYTPTTGTLTLGQPLNSALDVALANFMYGCAWRPEAHAMNGGLRSYFTFRINDFSFSSAPHEGFALTLVDGDNNGVDACGAAAQHLGYSGNNTESAFIAPPKIALEIDPRRESGFNVASTNHLLNGRNDPNYHGGHVALTYWGGESAINTTLVPAPTCTAPSFNSGGFCYLPQEEDDNVHGRPASARSGFAPPPANPSAPPSPPSVPPDSPGGVYKLDPHAVSVPSNQDFHVRIELTRTTTTDFALPQVRVATDAPIVLASPGDLIDGVPLFDGDRILVKNQLAPHENGLYVWHRQNAPMVRASDADSTVGLAGLTVEVQQGVQNARSIWRQNNTNAEIGTDSLTWTNTRVKVAAPAATSIASPGAVLDGIRMKPGDRVFVKTVGVYVWNGASSPMSAATDIYAGSAIQVQQGSEAPGWWQFDGTSWRSLQVRAATQGPLDLSNPGASIGGVALVSGDRVLVSKQSYANENGIYVWNGAAASMTRADDADSAIELAGALTQVREGNDAGRSFRQTTMPASGTIEAQAVHWTAIDGSPNYLLEVWILPDSVTYANMIAAMKDTTRAMGVLYPAFTPHLRDAPNIPYPFRNVRLGFTTGQRTTIMDQNISIRNSFTSWLP